MDDNIRLINSGTEKIRLSVAGSVKINDSMKNIKDKIREIGRQSENIDEILKAINDISAKTNILSMNASIEAAHSGDYGRGFAVVAAEVRNLAASSAKSVKDISVLINGIKESIRIAITMTETGEKETEAGQAVSREAGEFFETINKNIENANSMVDRISEIIELQTKSTMQVSDNAEEMHVFSNRIKKSVDGQADNSHEIVRGINEFNVATDENTKSAAKLSVLSKDLKEQNEKLTAIVQQFKLNEEK